MEIGLKKPQYQKLRNLSFSRFDWLYLAALESVLLPFYRATKLLSGSKYPTLSISYHVLKGLKNFLTTFKDDQPIENSLKKLLLIEFDYYFDQEVTWEQKRATMIAAFLDPTTYRFLNDEELREAEQAILSEFDVHQSLRRLRTNLSTTTTNAMPMSALPQQQATPNNTTSFETSSLDEFLRVCEMPLPPDLTTTSVKKQLPFKEELCQYMATARSSSNFIQYWRQNGELLPELLRFVKRYNCIPATSVPCEGSFSVAGHVQRKTRSSLSSTALRYSMILHE